ncbi:MAG: thioredoxin family protein [Phycisphaeraceae bacterium]|nr:thioredoxin family protein [Phycisphaeraceae bacterium]
MNEHRGSLGPSRRAVWLMVWGLLLVLTGRLTWAQFDLPGMQPTPSAAPLLSELVWSGAMTHADDRRVLAVVIDIQRGYHVNPDADQLPADLDWLIPTQITATVEQPGLTLGPVQYPPAATVTVNYTGTPSDLPVFEGRAVAYVPVTIGPQTAVGEHLVKVEIRYQACTNTSCLPPRTVTLTTSLQVVPPENSAAREERDQTFAGFDDSRWNTPAGVTTVPSTKAGPSFDVFGWRLELASGGSGGWGFYPLLLLLAALGGMLLNFTPCVLPVIPIKMLSLTRSAASRGRAAALGVALFAGVILFWLGLGVAIAVSAALAAKGFTGGIGSTNQLFQYPWFTITVGLVIAVMSVAMCGLFAIPLPRWIFRIEAHHDTIPGSLGFGVMTAVLSTPCTAPLMGAAAAWAAGQSAIITLATFAAIGLGMGIPYLVLSIWPRLVSWLPKAGPASELLKQVMGLCMLAAAAFFIGTGVSGLLATPIAPPTKAYWWFVFGLVALAGLWLSFRTLKIATGGRRIVFVILGLLAAAGSVYGAIRATEKPPIEWVYYTPESFEHAQQSGKVIVLEFTAEWCLNCKVLEHTTLNNPKVIEAFKLPGVVPMKVDLTGNNPDGNAKLQSVGRVAIPALVILAPDGKQVFNGDFYTPEQVLEALRAASE